MKPLIGICTYDPAEIGTDSKHYEHHYAVPTAYIDAVRRAGGATVLLASGEDAVDRWLVALDGVIVTGGTDIDPRIYGGDANDARVRAVAPSRDDMELALGRAVLDAGVPTLFVCRGLQVLNVSLGGTLHPHLLDLGRGDIHRNEDGLWTKHVVNVESGSLLATAMGATEASPISGHHQGVDRLGEGLAVVAVAPDGVIEGLEVPGHPWAVAVQWHPEVTAAGDATQQGIFDALVRAASVKEARAAADDAASRVPKRRLAVVTCMDARVDPWRILRAVPGDIHVIRNAGGVVTDDVIRSLVVSTRLLGVTEVQLIMHTDCGMEGLDREVVERSLGPLPFDLLGFADVREELRRGVDRIRDVQLLDLRGGVTGLLFDVTTGRLQPSVS